jgi:4-amino-4-deoxy-L-arabinose transferase-like glycosyltransferase
MLSAGVAQAAESTSAEPTSIRRTGRATPVIAIIALAVLLSVGFGPALFDRVTTFDDEGFFLASLREFLRHGKLYVHTKSSYGPFYYSAMGAIYRVTGQSPSLFTGRLIALSLTALSVGVFAATVWKVTRSLAWSLFCETVTFVVLIKVAGNEPMHPGILVVLLVSLLLYALASYAREQRRRYAWIIGLTVGAALMTKINVGLFATAAVVVAFVIGNSRVPRRLQSLVVVGALLFPFVLMSQLLWQVVTAEFALVVSIGLLLTFVPMKIEEVALPRRMLPDLALAAGAMMLASFVWPLLSGTTPSALVNGVLIRPLRQADYLATASAVDFEWLAFLITVCVVAWAWTRRTHRDAQPIRPAWLPDAALGVAGLYVLGLAILGAPSNFLAWLPAIALLPALAWIAAVPSDLRLVLRFLVPVAILQILHAYPVAGAQRSWGLVAVCVPCVIAMALAANRLPLWVQADRGARAVVVGILATLFVLGAGVSPYEAWHSYGKLTPLRLTGARMVRLPARKVQTLQSLTRVVRSRCDTFYSAPGFDSLYIYTGLPAPTGLLSNWPGGLSTSEQQDLANQLAQAQAKGERVCIVRNLARSHEWLSSSYGSGPLGKSLALYNTRIARVGLYSVSVLGSHQSKR